MLFASFATAFVRIPSGLTLTLLDVAQNLPELVVRRGMQSSLLLLLLIRILYLGAFNNRRHSRTSVATLNRAFRRVVVVVVWIRLCDRVAIQGVYLLKLRRKQSESH